MMIRDFLKCCVVCEFCGDFGERERERYTSTFPGRT